MIIKKNSLTLRQASHYSYHYYIRNNLISIIMFLFSEYLFNMFA
nr:MAG TPA: hypothetical protein [Caudoviricetes sp.]